MNLASRAGRGMPRPYIALSAIPAFPSLRALWTSDLRVLILSPCSTASTASANLRDLRVLRSPLCPYAPLESDSAYCSS